MPKPGGGKKDFWDILNALGPAIIAAVVAVLGISYNTQQASIAKSSEMRQVYTNIMAQRETSDNSIRASMFQMLLNAMFIKDLGTPSKDAPDDINGVKQRIMFLDLLSRNFDTIDIKPLFEELDHDLTKKLSDPGLSGQQRGDFFDMRSELRRIGRNLSIKQLNALASLPGSEVARYVILKDAKGNLQVMQDESVSKGSDTPQLLEIKPQDIYNGIVDISLEYKKSKTSDSSFKAPSFIITVYDLPYIDNSVLDKDMRVGVVLSKYVETGDLVRFRDRLDRKLLKDYEDLREDGISQYAELRIIKFPAKYIGNRDRPYLQDIIQTLLEEQKEGNTGKVAATN
jgi:hypothetical protein